MWHWIYFLVNVFLVFSSTIDIAASLYVWYVLPDSVEEGEKIVNAAIDKFGRIGELIHIFGNKA